MPTTRGKRGKVAKSHGNNIQQLRYAAVRHSTTTGAQHKGTNDNGNKS